MSKLFLNYKMPFKPDKILHDISIIINLYDINYQNIMDKCRYLVKVYINRTLNVGKNEYFTFPSVKLMSCFYLIL